MTPDPAPVPAAPTPLTPQQIRAIHGRSAVEDPNGEITDYVTWASLDDRGVDDRGPDEEAERERLALLVEAILAPDSRRLPWVDAETIARDVAQWRMDMRADAAAADFVSGAWS